MLSRLLRVFGRRRDAAASPQSKHPVPASGVASAANDTERRALDIARLDDPTALYPLCDRERDRKPAISRLAELAAAGQAETILRARPDLGPALLDATTDKALAERLLGAVGEPTELLRIAGAASTPHVRAAAAARLQDDASLHLLERNSRKHDKAVHRLVKERLELRKTLAARCAAQAEQLTALEARAAHIRTHDSDPHVLGRIEVAERALRDWQRTQDATVAELATHAASEAAVVDGLRAEVAQLATRVQTLNGQLAALRDQLTVARNLAAAATEAHDKTAAAAAVGPTSDADAAAADGQAARTHETAVAAIGSTIAEPTYNAEQQATIAELRAIAHDLRKAGSGVLERIAMVPAALELLERRWAAASEDDVAPPSAHSDYTAAHRTLRNAVDAGGRIVGLRAEIDAASAALAVTAPEVDADADAWQQYWLQLDAVQRSLALARSGLARLSWPSELPQPAELAGLTEQLGPAERLLQQAREPLHALNERTQHLVDELRQLLDAGILRDAAARLADARRLVRAQPDADGKRWLARLAPLASQLDELRDWQGYATRPKREALLERIHALADSPCDDPVVRADAVKQLRAEWRGLGPLADRSERTLAGQFDAAAERAYEPARVHFAAEAERRSANLAARQRVLDTLRSYMNETDWQQADWKLAAEVLRVAREEFFAYAPVDRTAGREQTALFDSELGRLRALLDAEYDRNERAKEQLIAQAEALTIDAAELSLRIDRAKELQRQWRLLGVTRRNKGDALWQRFRQHCDALFAQRDSARADAAAATAAAQQQAATLLDALEARLAEEAPISDEAALQETRNALEALDLARDAARPLQRRWRELEQRYLQRQREHQLSLTTAQWQRWLALHDALAAASSGSGPWPEPRSAEEAEVIDSRRAAADATDRDESAQRDARHRATLMAEILADVESPAEDRARRMALQVERLARRSRGGTPEALSFASVLAAWVAAAHGADGAERARISAAVSAYPTAT